MSLEIWPFEGEVIAETEDVKKYSKVHHRRSGKGAYAVVPEGANAKVRINGVSFRIRNYRGRPGHTAGAVVEGDGVKIDLDTTDMINAICFNIFRYKK